MSIGSAEELLRDVWGGSPWYGKSVYELLSRINYHSEPIMDIINHMVAWRLFALYKIQGTDYKIEMDSLSDWPKGQEKDIAQAVSYLSSNLEDIITEIKKKDDNWLLQKVIGENYSYQFLIEGIVQHDIYHVGQITLLHKLGM